MSINIEKEANRGIVGLGAGPYCVEDSDGNMPWPMGGYDEALREFHWDAEGVLARAGRSKEDWLELADVMLQRWLDFKNAVEKLP